MKQKIILATFFLMILSLSVFVSAQETCSEGEACSIYVGSTIEFDIEGGMDLSILEISSNDVTFKFEGLTVELKDDSGSNVFSKNGIQLTLIDIIGTESSGYHAVVKAEKIDDTPQITYCSEGEACSIYVGSTIEFDIEGGMDLTILEISSNDVTFKFEGLTVDLKDDSGSNVFSKNGIQLTLIDIIGTESSGYHAVVKAEKIEDTPQITSQCKDGDGGKNPTILGKAEIEGAGGQGDWCDYSKGENKIYEAYCINDTAYTTILMDCPTDKPYCNKGKCSASKPQCTEDDGGKNPLILGTTFPSRIADHTGSTDYCQITSTGQPPESGECSGSDCSLREFFCVEGSPDEFYNDIPCPSGCKNGVCSKIEPTEETGPIDIVEETEGVKEEIKVVREDCNGCILDKKCYPIGYRMENTFCDNQQFSNQKEADSSCNNNFECSTNLCIDNECVSSGFWQKIMRFFKNLFG